MTITIEHCYISDKKPVRLNYDKTLSDRHICQFLQYALYNTDRQYRYYTDNSYFNILDIHLLLV